MQSYLRLCRLPAVFTALADICAGFLLTHLSLEQVGDFVALLIASAGLYLSGMVFNDVFDVDVDRKERPRRPIPSGEVPLRNAIGFGVMLMLVGIAAAAVAGLNSLWMALLLAAAIFLYNGVLKKTPVGPVSMGLCRFLNLLLGASGAAETFSEIWQLPQLWMALCMGVYITGVTWFARREAQSSSSIQLIAALCLLDLGLLMLGAWMGGWLKSWGWAIPDGAVNPPQSMLFLLAVIALTINRRAIAAINRPGPSHVQMAVGTMLLSIISIDAMAIYYAHGTEGLAYAIGTLALAIPAVFLRRWISMT
ncbi:UbiA family prenyltransferase [Planctomicrobium piriforme]|uniref:4-hydroxybenzoate polyprenyltransferase n=1 Tax=Planctomicrobium piriforme TaxID=1576369 RepID=A0A1I3HXB8_9PLAN|nr:UbiA family prenyltransferase [Planctomicrobium piriforme]SFI40331.1 4-hydroxybenzoate polyprenyltransferase [Planctomicrobium piriforme]